MFITNNLRTSLVTPAGAFITAMLFVSAAIGPVTVA